MAPELDGEWDVAIIGAGFAGLAAGVRLAHFGRRVVILERHSLPGGLNSYYKKGGFVFDTGLHAVTNFLGAGGRGSKDRRARVPIQRICRQLRLDVSDFELSPQTYSQVYVGDARLRFANDGALLEDEVRAAFPAEIDGLRRLAAACADYPDFLLDTPRSSARAVLAELIRDPLLRELLLVPVLWYGSAEEDDIDFQQFIILWKSIYEEGFGRPPRGVRPLLELLVGRFTALGGVLARNTGVARLAVEDRRVSSVVLDDGQELRAEVILSSAGRVETARLRSDLAPTAEDHHAGRLGFVESIWALDRPPGAIGHDACITFFSREPRISWRSPEVPVDYASGVICCPSNYGRTLGEGAPLHGTAEGPPLVRATHLASPELWMTMPEQRYLEEKERFVRRSLDTVTRYVGDFGSMVRFTDAFTPKTVQRYTGRENGAIYGSPDKVKTGRTDLANLFLCGTDQGLVGIVGTMLSGIAMANAFGMEGRQAVSGSSAGVERGAAATPAPAAPPPSRWRLAPPAPTSPSGLEARRQRRAAADHLGDLRESYDLVVIGSGLAGLTAANRLGRAGWSVLLLEQHYNFGGMATWFKRQNGHIFDISLHGFPVGMIKTCRKYWSKEIADSIVRLRSVRFDNPQFRLETTYDRVDFTRALREELHVPGAAIEAFFEALKGSNLAAGSRISPGAEPGATPAFDEHTTTRELFERFFPGRSDVWRLLIEPIAYANGSTLDDPAMTFAIVFSNFMSEGVFTFRGGTNVLIKAMKAELAKSGVELRNHAPVERILVAGGRTAGVVVNGREVKARAVLSNANLRTTIRELVGVEAFSPELVRDLAEVRMNNSSSQVYIGIERGQTLPFVGELLFSSTAPEFDSTALCALDCTSRTFSFYYPEIRPGSDRYTVVASINSNYRDWASMSDEEYLRAKERLARESLEALERYIPGVQAKVDHVEVSTPRTFEYFTRHESGASFGTKFEGLGVSQRIAREVPGLFHAGSVGIIMSGWLGAANYGVIVANEVDRFLASEGSR